MEQVENWSLLKNQLIGSAKYFPQNTIHQYLTLDVAPVFILSGMQKGV